MTEKKLNVFTSVATGRVRAGLRCSLALLLSFLTLAFHKKECLGCFYGVNCTSELLDGSVVLLFRMSFKVQTFCHKIIAAINVLAEQLIGALRSTEPYCLVGFWAQPAHDSCSIISLVPAPLTLGLPGRVATSVLSGGSAGCHGDSAVLSNKRVGWFTWSGYKMSDFLSASFCHAC